jgi:hypothetical protein
MVGSNQMKHNILIMGLQCVEFRIVFDISE